ncbi:MAG: peptidoglycan DD-metalloendopeptidase family protein [Bacteroidales bacterium]
MTDFLTYIIQVNLGIMFLYLIYRSLLNKNVKSQVKRFYLIGSLIFAFILPIVQFTEFDSQRIVQGSQAFSFQETEKWNKLQFLPTSDNIQILSHFSFFSIIAGIYFFMGALLLSRLIIELIRLLQSIVANKKIHFQKVNLVINEKYSNPYSFFNYLFTSCAAEIEKKPEYFHELAHIKQLHSIDRLLVELSIPLLWINPFIYLIRKSMIEVHEHLADSFVIRNGVEPGVYQKYLYLQLKSGRGLKLTSNFNYSLTKKRITMISNKTSIKKSILKTTISLVLVSYVMVFYGFINRKTNISIGRIDNLEQTKPESFTPSILPLKEGGEYWIGSYYGMRKHPVLGTQKMHNGIDIIAPSGTEVIAPADGVVLEAVFKGEYGNLIKLKHDDEFITVFAHLSGFKVNVGDIVKTRDVIGYVGSTGLATQAHLHYEIRKYPDTDPITYFDPANFIKNIKQIPEKVNKDQ